MFKNRYRFIRPQFSLGVIGLIIGLTACPTPSTAPVPGFSLKLLAAGVQVTQGSSAELEVSLNRDRFTDPITVTASELPAGITAGAVTTTGSSSADARTDQTTFLVQHDDHFERPIKPEN